MKPFKFKPVWMWGWRVDSNSIFYEKEGWVIMAPTSTTYSRPGKADNQWKLRLKGTGCNKPTTPGEANYAYTDKEKAFRSGNEVVKQWKKSGGW